MFPLKNLLTLRYLVVALNALPFARDRAKLKLPQPQPFILSNQRLGGDTHAHYSVFSLHCSSAHWPSVSASTWALTVSKMSLKIGLVDVLPMRKPSMSYSWIMFCTFCMVMLPPYRMRVISDSFAPMFSLTQCLMKLAISYV